ncbi:MAG: proliferating cell nuclear antigen (pcna) [Candidatus Aenigmarchaeota archaeon ex4484_14]|nr:MAG: proliferating cell nuclear antigen (pcna) [Candidatus Aenigmarchaeota archaeon ex4484_14]
MNKTTKRGVVGMFECELKDIGLLRNAMEPVIELIDEAPIKIAEDGLRIMASDRAVVAVVNLFLDKKMFVKYKLDAPLEIGVNLVNFSQILKRAASDDKLVMKAEKETLQLIFIGKSERTFTLPIISISSEDTPPIDKLQFSNIIKLKSKIIIDAINDADLVSDSLVFSATEKELKMSSSRDTTSMQSIVPKSQLEKLDIKEPCRSRFSLDYLKKIIKASKVAEDLEIALGTDYPMKMIFDAKHAHMEFILAPRVEE